MAKKKLNRSILIVCEGTKTEHDYFEFIASNISYPQKLWDNVDVCDNKTIPKDFPLTSPTELGTRKKKQFTNPNKRIISERNILKELCLDIYGEIEGIDEYENSRAVPLRYVAQAQLIEQKQQMYEELWAVFDMDGHSHHKQAYERAEKLVNGKKVQIGLTSRSFEHWLLLHFEKNKIQFSSSECKNGNKKPLECNSEKGCKGDICLVGYLRTNTPLKNYEKSNNSDDLKNMMELLLKTDYLNNAFENAIWLRDSIKNDSTLKDKKCYELNPYTDIDILVKKLIE
jgi:hypothetical protein